MVGVGAWASRRWQGVGQAVMILGGIGLVAVIVLQVRQNLLPPRPPATDRREMAVSCCLANVMLGDLAGQDATVVLLFPERRILSASSEESYENGFVPPLRHSRGKLALKAIHMDGSARDLSAFQKALAQAPEATVVISYAGVPPGFDTLYAGRQSNLPLFYVFDADRTTNWVGALKEGHIRAVAIPRAGPAGRGGETIAGMPDQIFQTYFLLATPATADETAASLKQN